MMRRYEYGDSDERGKVGRWMADVTTPNAGDVES
jgi:hypothetical protein